jgi:hypothetical protein
MIHLYTDIESLVLWAGSEKIGCVLNICRGMMEYWNVGVLSLAECDLFLSSWQGAENQFRPSSAFDPQYSIFPPFHYSMGSLTANTTPLWGEAKA